MESHHLMMKNMTVYSEQRTIEKGFVEIQGSKITRVGDVHDLTEQPSADIIELDSDLHLIPGFIDLHIHGVNGADTMDATPEALETIAISLPQEGTTSFLATTMTQESWKIEKALQNVGQFIRWQNDHQGAEVLGVHLEGPFISKKKAGAQSVSHIKNPDIGLFHRWQKLADGAIRIVTAAPELPGGLPFIEFISRNGTIASIGHSNATYESVQHAIQKGARQVTHLYNQMSGLHHREPGVVGAALLQDELYTEIIADGIHVHPDVIRLAFQQKTKNRIILITDAIRAKGLDAGTYELGGQRVRLKHGEARLFDGTLAGSVLKMNKAAKNMRNYTGCRMEDIIAITSVNPAKQLGIYDRKGSISPGKDADLVIVNDDFDVIMTFCRGRLAYQKKV